MHVLLKEKGTLGYGPVVLTAHNMATMDTSYDVFCIISCLEYN